MKREIRYCTTEDGVRIAYCVEGEGPPLLCCPSFVQAFSLTHLVPVWKAFFDEIGRGRSLIRYDMRGTGLSQRDVTDFSGPALVLDIAAVVRAVGLKRFALWGVQFSGPRAVMYAAQHPEQVSHLILASTFARPRQAFPYETAKGLAELCRTNWRLGVQTLTDMGIRQHVADPGKRQMYAELSLQIARLTEQSTEGRVAASLILEGYESGDVGHLLGQVRAKTLVFHHLDDVIFPVSMGRELAADISGAVFVPLEGERSNVGYVPEETEAVVSAVNRFLGQRRGKAPSASPTPVRTVLFTDIVGHTEMMQRLGDERGRGVLREHERITREVLKAHGGTEVKTMGDGFMASFGSVTRAVECAVALQRAFEEWNAGVGAHGRAPLQVRCGLNAGEPIEEEGDLFGATVILASRIAGKADGGEILASDVVRGLCSGKGFVFSDRGEFVAKGFEEPVRVFEVRWQE